MTDKSNISLKKFLISIHDGLHLYMFCFFYLTWSWLILSPVILSYRTQTTFSLFLVTGVAGRRKFWTITITPIQAPNNTTRWVIWSSLHQMSHLVVTPQHIKWHIGHLRWPTCHSVQATDKNISHLLLKQWRICEWPMWRLGSGLIK